MEYPDHSRELEKFLIKHDLYRKLLPLFYYCQNYTHFNFFDEEEVLVVLSFLKENYPNLYKEYMLLLKPSQIQGILKVIKELKIQLSEFMEMYFALYEIEIQPQLTYKRFYNREIIKKMTDILATLENESTILSHQLPKDESKPSFPRKKFTFKLPDNRDKLDDKEKR